MFTRSPQIKNTLQFESSSFLFYFFFSKGLLEHKRVRSIFSYLVLYIALLHLKEVSRERERETSRQGEQQQVNSGEVKKQVIDTLETKQKAIGVNEEPQSPTVNGAAGQKSTTATTQTQKVSY